MDRVLRGKGVRVGLTKTSRAFSQFPDNSPLIVFPCCGAQSTLRCDYIWWCLVAYSCYWLFFFDRVGAGSVRADAAVGPTVRCPVIDDVGY